jgi:hypothetical protein
MPIIKQRIAKKRMTNHRASRPNGQGGILK